MCYGVQYDSVLQFISDVKDIHDSTSWGNYLENEFVYIGEACAVSGNWQNLSEKIKSSDTDLLLQTGAYEINKAKNIYDLAGNVAERTMERGKSWGSSWDDVFRGGSFSYGTGSSSAAVRCPNMSDAYIESFGFRVALYITSLN